MMRDVLAALLELNVAFAGAILLVLTLREPVRRWIGARNAFALWALPLIAGLAVLVPARPAPPPPPIFLDEAARATPPDASTWAARDSGAWAPAAQSAPDPAISALFDGIPWEAALLACWAGVAAFALGGLLWRQRRFLAAISPLQLREKDGARIYRTSIVGVGPALVGALRPRLIVPADFETRFTAQEQALIIAHEHAHQRRLDAQTNAFASILAALFWFNPLLAFAQRRMREDQELACDETVLEDRRSLRRDYAQALLKSQLGPQPVPLGCAWPSASLNPLKRRIEQLRQAPLSVRRERLGAGLILAAGVATGCAAWSAQPPEAHVAADAPTDVSLANDALEPARSVASAAQSSDARSSGARPIGSSGSFIDALAAAGYRNLTAEQLIALKIHDVDLEALGALRRLGLDPSPEELIDLAVAEVTPEFVEETRAHGWAPLSIGDLVAMRHMDVNPSDAERFTALGLSEPSPDQMIAFAALDIDEDYIRELAEAGIREPDPDAYIDAAALGVTPAFIAEARSRGFRDLTLDKLARLKAADIF